MHVSPNMQMLEMNAVQVVRENDNLKRAIRELQRTQTSHEDEVADLKARIATHKREVEKLEARTAGPQAEAKPKDDPPWLMKTGDLLAMGVTTSALVFCAAEGTLHTFKGFMACLPAMGSALNSVHQKKVGWLVALFVLCAAMTLAQSAYVAVTAEGGATETMQQCADMLKSAVKDQCSCDNLGTNGHCMVQANLGRAMPCNVTLTIDQPRGRQPGQPPAACAGGAAGLALRALGFAEHKFFTPDQAVEIFQRTESELKKKHPAAYPGGFKSPPHAVFANPGGDVDGDNAISVAELLSAIPRLYSEPALQQWYNAIVATIYEFRRTQ